MKDEFDDELSGVPPAWRSPRSQPKLELPTIAKDVEIREDSRGPGRRGFRVPPMRKIFAAFGCLMVGVWVPSIIGAILPDGWQNGANWWATPAVFSLTLLGVASAIIGGLILFGDNEPE